MVSGTWISSQQKGTIALRMYWEISANQCVLHWGREAEMGRRTQRCLCELRHTIRCPHMLVLPCVLCVCEGSEGFVFWRDIRKCSHNSAELTKKLLPWSEGINLSIFKIYFCLCFFCYLMHLCIKDSGLYEWATRKPNWTMIGKKKESKQIGYINL